MPKANYFTKRLSFNQMDFSVTYKLIGPGWAECIVLLNRNFTVLTASYLEDALGNLADATLRIAQGEKLTYAIFAEEPGEYRWKFTRIDNEKISVEILEFDEWRGLKQSDEKGKIIFQFECPLLVLVRRIIICLSEVLNEYGLEGYAEKWMMHEFPLKVYNELRNILHDIKN